ncbi:MAG: hypothetical protein ISS72_04250 [Candidatus Brocadiae bacterium]|nr:hypothetical protein [Candidatus Brocadiia bacterium]
MNVVFGFFHRTWRYFADHTRGFWELARELGYYLADNQRWWLTPIVVVMLLLSLILVLAASPLGPAFYAIF